MKILDNIETGLKTHYDKLLAFLTLSALIGSLIYLAIQIGMIQKLQRDWEKQLGDMKPTYPIAEAQDETLFQDAEKTIREPFQIIHNAWTNKPMFVPEQRVWCADCRWPIPYSAEKCPFCGSPQPIDGPGIDQDSDNDLMPDKWEREHQLNPFDASDADKDPDQDNFTNLEEHRAGTDPQDPKSHPETPGKLRLTGIDAQPFTLKFRSTVLSPDGFRRFGLNRTAGGRTDTFFKKTGEEIGGFRLAMYVERFEMQSATGSMIPQKADVSELTLARPDRVIVLKKNEDVPQSEYIVHMLFVGENREIVCKQNEVFKLKEEKYKMLRIDFDRGSVVIEREQDGKQFIIQRLPVKGRPFGQ